MKDYLVKATTTDGMFRAYATNATATVATAQKDHHTSPVAITALGRTLIGTIMLATSVDKNGEAITVKVDGKGPLGQIVADGDSQGRVKGYLQHPQFSIPATSQHQARIGEAVGTNGFLEVTRASEHDDPYTSSVPLASGEIGDDLTYYLAQSEQIPSVVGVSVYVNDDLSVGAAGGYMVQTLPGTTDEAINKVIDRIKQIPQISQLLMDNQTPEGILHLIFGKGNLHFLSKMPVEFYCNCSKEKFARDLTGLSVAQLETMMKEDHEINVTCNFCQSKYHYNDDELAAIIATAKARQSK